MSGGPVVTTDGEIVGVNVAKHVGGELVSFLVPARFAKALVDRARSSPPLTTADSRKEIGRQLGVWQGGLYQALGEQGFRTSAFGPYVAPESNAPWFTCWARTNADVLPKPRALASTTNCSMQTSLFIAGDLQTGQVDLAHSYVRSIDLNAFQFQYLSFAAIPAFVVRHRRALAQAAYGAAVPRGFHRGRGGRRAPDVASRMVCARLSRIRGPLRCLGDRRHPGPQPRSVDFAPVDARGHLRQCDGAGETLPRSRLVGEMISVEVLSRHRDVVARYRSDAPATTVGRAYDNDVVVDDPAVAAHHLRIFATRAER